MTDLASNLASRVAATTFKRFSRHKHAKKRFIWQFVKQVTLDQRKDDPEYRIFHDATV